ncbi:hypothetical protein Hanom_Chr04g00356881 [Helianthus anomalus]
MAAKPLIKAAIVMTEKKMDMSLGTNSIIVSGVLGQRRTNFQGNQFPLAAGAGRKDVVAPLRNSNFYRNQTVTSYRPRQVLYCVFFCVH